MKKLNVLLFITIFSVLFFTGCTWVGTATSVMVRTVGIGESALPIANRDRAIEIFSDKATSVDEIVVTSTGSEQKVEGFQPNKEIITSGRTISYNFRYHGLNFRYGIGNLAEVKAGFFLGKMKRWGKNDERDLKVSYTGLQLGLKHLMTDYTNPHRISIYLDWKAFAIMSEEGSSGYDGTCIEFKPALIYGYLKDPASRNFPSFSLYYSLSNTNRGASIEGIPAKKQPQAVGAETNLNLAYGPIYTNIAVGLEKEIAYKSTDKIKPYFGMKVGFHFKRNK